MAAQFEILPGLPGTDPRPEQFSATGHGTHSEGFVVRFLPEQSESWVGNFQGGFGQAQGVYLHPDGKNILVIAAGQGYVVDPESRTLMETWGPDIQRCLILSDLNILAVSNGLWFEGFGSNGLAWRTRRFSWDGIRSVERDDFVLRGEAFSPLDDDWHPFSLDLLSGDVDGGSYEGT